MEILEDFREISLWPLGIKCRLLDVHLLLVWYTQLRLFYIGDHWAWETNDLWFIVVMVNDPKTMT
jgi:hypothetical protein